MSDLDDEVITDLEKSGYTLHTVLGYFENYNSEFFIVTEDDKSNLYISHFVYCSCFDVYRESAQNIIAVQEPLDSKYIEDMQQEGGYFNTEDVVNELYQILYDHRG